LISSGNSLRDRDRKEERISQHSSIVDHLLGHYLKVLAVTGIMQVQEENCVTDLNCVRLSSRNFIQLVLGHPKAITLAMSGVMGKLEKMWCFDKMKRS
jgi:hypothetical protein